MPFVRNGFRKIPTTNVASSHTLMGCSPPEPRSILKYERRQPAAHRGDLPMMHDLVLATVFLSMIIAPALVAMRADVPEEF